jgi:hypothetical protein
MAAIAIASIIVRAPSSGAAQIFRKATDQNFWNHQLLDEAIARGWDTVSRLELDGWELFEAVVARLGPDCQ